MGYISTKELAKNWSVDPSLVLRLARQGRIEGALHIDNRWLFPQDTKKPDDGRTRKAKSEKKVFFRFPIYVNFAESAYFPPLTYEEKQLRTAQLAFHACRFDEARELLVPLSGSEKNCYVRISALYHLLYIARYTYDPDYDLILSEIHSALAQDFPYKKEMLLFRYLFEADIGSYQSLLEEFHIDSEYFYHRSAYSTLALVSLLPIENGDITLLSHLRYDTYELLCQQMEREGYYWEVQKLHYLLLIVYQLQLNKGKMLYHARCGLRLAMEHGLYFAAANFSNYYPEPTATALRDFPEDFSRKIRALSVRLQQAQHSPFLSVLSGRDYALAFLATQSYTNREIAAKLRVSEKYVSRRYSAIYDKLNIAGKKELVALIRRSCLGERTQ